MCKYLFQYYVRDNILPESGLSGKILYEKGLSCSLKIHNYLSWKYQKQGWHSRQGGRVFGKKKNNLRHKVVCDSVMGN